MTGLSQKLYQRIADDISVAIADGTYPPGSRLPSERDLAEKFNVSRPTIREAMIALEMRELVEARKGSGVYVLRAPARGVVELELDVGAFELIEARTLFEGEAAALAAASITPLQLAQLHTLLKVMDADCDAPEAVDADRQFHLLIAEATANTLVHSAVETLWDIRDRSPLCARMFAQARREGVTPRVAEHRQILDALERHDPYAAREAMRSHLKRVTDDLLETTRLDLMKKAEAEFDAQRNRVVSRAIV